MILTWVWRFPDGKRCYGICVLGSLVRCMWRVTPCSETGVVGPVRRLMQSLEKKGRRVSCRDRDGLPYTGLLITNSNLFPIALRVKVSGCQHGQFLVRALFQVVDANFLFFPHMILFCPHNSLMTLIKTLVTSREL